jgi:hypothetical protein
MYSIYSHRNAKKGGIDDTSSQFEELETARLGSMGRDNLDQAARRLAAEIWLEARIA